MWKGVLACVIAAGIAGTAHGQTAGIGGMCPVMTEGAKLATVDTPDGVALDFTIAGDPTGLRARVHQMAAAHNQTPGRMTIKGSGSAATEVQVVPSHARAQDTPNGARLVLTADDPARVGELRQQMRDKVASCSPRATPAAAGGDDPPPMPPGMCPMMGADTKVSAVDTSDGVAMVFTTSSDPADLRARVRAMAEMHNKMHATGSGSAAMGRRGRMVPSAATAEEVPGGARLVFRPLDPAQLATLRDQARHRAEMMQKGDCPMMRGSGD